MPCDFKLTKPNAPTRRASFVEPPRWSALAERIEHFYNIPASNVGVTYRDSDGDEITLNTEDELADFYRTSLHDGEVIRFTVHDLGPSRRDRSRSRTLDDENDMKELDDEMKTVVDELQEASREAGEAMREAQEAAQEAAAAAQEAASAAVREAAQAAANAGTQAAEAGRRMMEGAAHMMRNFHQYRGSMMADPYGFASGMWGAFEGGRRGRGGGRGGRGGRHREHHMHGMHGFFPFMGPGGPTPAGPPPPHSAPFGHPPPVPTPPPPPSSSSDAMDEDNAASGMPPPPPPPPGPGFTNFMSNVPLMPGMTPHNNSWFGPGPRGGFSFGRQWNGPHGRGRASFAFGGGPPGSFNSESVYETETPGAGPSRHGHRHHHHHHHGRRGQTPPSPPSPPTPPSPPSPPSGRRTPHPHPPPPGGWEDLGKL